PGLLGGEPGDALQLGLARDVGPGELGGLPVQFLLALVKAGDLVLDPSQLVIKAALALTEPRLPAPHVAPQLADLVLDRADPRLPPRPPRAPGGRPAALRPPPAAPLAPPARRPAGRCPQPRQPPGP